MLILYWTCSSQSTPYRYLSPGGTSTLSMEKVENSYLMRNSCLFLATFYCLLCIFRYFLSVHTLILSILDLTLITYSIRLRYCFLLKMCTVQIYLLNLLNDLSITSSKCRKYQAARKLSLICMKCLISVGAMKRSSGLYCFFYQEPIFRIVSHISALVESC